MKLALHRWYYRYLCAKRHRLEVAIAKARIRAGYKSGGRAAIPEPTGVQP